MQVQDFTENKEVQLLINSLQNEFKDKQYSDIIDKNGNQYVDLIQEGYGTLWFALLGYTFVLEKIGIRFFSLGGTSTGAINTIFIAALGSLDVPKTEKMIEYFLNKNIFELVDGPFRVKQFFKCLNRYGNYKSGFFGKLIITFWVYSLILHLVKYKGMNYGEELRKWISEILKKNNINSIIELLDIRERTDEIFLREGQKGMIDDLVPKLKIFTNEVTTESNIIFPEMMHLFWDDPDNVNPADLVRASSSIPFIFHPFKINISKNIKIDDWQTAVKYYGEIGNEAEFVDSGITSNFPIYTFHNYVKIPRLPTFGVKFGNERDSLNSTKSITQFFNGILNSNRQVLDYQFLSMNDDYEKIISEIDIGAHNWLNFKLSDLDNLDLFIRGARAAYRFLYSFDWNSYKAIRSNLIGYVDETRSTDSLNKKSLKDNFQRRDNDKNQEAKKIVLPQDKSTQSSKVINKEQVIKNQVFISYSHEDNFWKNELIKVMKPYVRKKYLEFLYDDKINPGADFRNKIDELIEKANSCIVLVSADFLYSEFIDQFELPKLLKKAENNQLKIFWILIAECLYKESDISKFQAVHNIKRPLAMLQEYERYLTLTKISREILRNINI